MIEYVELLAALPSLGTWLLIAGLFLAAAVGLTFLLVRQRAGGSRSAPDRDGDDRIRSACAEAHTIVDLVTLTGNDNKPPSSVTLSDADARIRRLGLRLRGLPTATSSAGVVEAIEDVQRVAMSLSSALQVERSIRLGSQPVGAAERATSMKRIAKRAAELDLAASELLWIAETR